MLLRCPGPRWPPYQLYHSCCPRPLLATVPAIYFSAVRVPDGHRTSFTIPAVPVPFLATIPAIYFSAVPVLDGHRTSFNKISRKKRIVRRPPGSHRCRPVGPTHTAQTPIPSCLHQAKCIVLGCGSIVRGRKRKKVASIPLLLTSERHTGRARWQLFTRSVSTIQYPNHIYTKPL